MDLFRGLNPAQREAVEAVQGPVLVLAGPGSGKTRVLTNRIAALIQLHRVAPYHILAVTFTNKAAREMKERLKSLVGPDADEVAMGTFHAICARILRRDGRSIGVADSFSIYDSDDQLGLIRQAIKDMNLDEKRFTPRSVQAAISQAKSDLVPADKYRAKDYWHEVVGRLYSRYEELLASCSALDFDDLLMKTAQLFSRVPEVLEKYQQRYQFILVDEFQDTNMAQYALGLLLAARYRNIFVVGDEDQSIYSWRGADYRNVDRFRKDFPDAREILLEQNYRSTQTILDAANAVISRNSHRTPKALHTDRSGGAKINRVEAFNEEEEARFVVDEIERLVATGQAERGHVAVMYRTNAQSRALEDAFVYRGRPYRIVGATRFYERREIKDVLAFLRVINNPHDNVSMVRIINVPARGIGDKTVATLSGFAATRGLSLYDGLRALQEERSATILTARTEKPLLVFVKILDDLIGMRGQASVLELMDAVLERTGYARSVQDGTDEGQERWDNIEELRNVAAGYGALPDESALGVFLEEVSLVSDVDNLSESPDAPTLLTLHTAKGLEFGTVFMVGMNEGLLPHSRTLEDVNAMEEERRLCYVGITRAKERLYLLHAFRRSQYGRSEIMEPSRFLADIPAELIQGKGGAEKKALPRPVLNGRPLRPGSSVASRSPNGGNGGRESRAPASLRFQSGDVVSHPAFGEGTVLESRPTSGDEEVTVVFKGRGIKRLMASFANLRKLRSGR